jgi:TPR repeat protein
MRQKELKIVTASFVLNICFMVSIIAQIPIQPGVPTPTPNENYLDTYDGRLAFYDAEHATGRYNIKNQTESSLNTSNSITDFFKETNTYERNGEKQTGKKIIKKYKAEAEKGNEQNMLYMTLAYRLYLNDEPHEIIWLDKLVAINNEYALMRRADIYEDAKNINKSMQLYQQAVKAGNSVAMVGLAEKYLVYVKEQINKPVELLKAAVEKDNMEAAYMLANLYYGFYGKQYPVDYEKGLSLYLKFLQLSDVKSKDKQVITQRVTVMKNIALFYKNGTGVAKDNAAFELWMKKSKEEGNKIVH